MSFPAEKCFSPKKSAFPTEKCTFLQKNAFSCRKMHFPAEKCGFRGAHGREPQEIARGFQGSRIKNASQLSQDMSAFSAAILLPKKPAAQLGGCNLSGCSRILPESVGFTAASQTLYENDVFRLCPIPLYLPPPPFRSAKRTPCQETALTGEQLQAFREHNDWGQASQDNRTAL